MCRFGTKLYKPIQFVLYLFNHVETMISSTVTALWVCRHHCKYPANKFKHTFMQCVLKIIIKVLQKIYFSEYSWNMKCTSNVQQTKNQLERWTDIQPNNRLGIICLTKIAKEFHYNIKIESIILSYWPIHLKISN